MISYVMLNKFEYCLLPIIQDSAELNSRQYGFRKESSYRSAITVLKENTAHERDHGNHVHAMPIDSSEAFERLNMNFLIEKLLKTRVPKIFIKRVSQMLNSTHVKVLFGKSMSSDFEVGNGTRQDELLSLLLYNIYINDVIESIPKMLNRLPTKVL